MRFARSEGREFKRRYKRKRSIAAHPIFVPAIVVWGAALFGLAMFVLPASTVQSVASTVGLGSLGGWGRIILAVLVALLGAAVARIFARKWQAHRGVNSKVAKAGATDDIDAIDPSQELGSESLDAPIADDFGEQDIAEEGRIEESDFEEDDVLELSLEELAENNEDAAWIDGGEDVVEDDTADRLTLGEEIGEEAQAPLTAQPSPRAKRGFPFSRRSKPGSASTGVKQVELVRAMKGHLARQTEKIDAATPGAMREDDAAPICEVAPTAPIASSLNTPPPPRPTGSAVDRLREIPPHELSLVQMVERFAAALHDHQEAAHARAAAGAPAGREAELAEALKALAVFTQDRFTQDSLSANLGATATAGEAAPDPEAPAKPEIRDAMAKLQKLRGAA